MPRKKTTAEFVADARRVHGDRFDYSKVNYKNSITKVVIGCPVHGNYLQIPRGHLQGKGCAKCAGKIQKTTDRFVEDAQKIHGDRYDYSRVVYKNGKTKVVIICREHGEFKQIPKSHLKGRGCPECGGSNKKTTAEFIADAKAIHGECYDYNKVVYKNAHSKVVISCPEHGDFEQKPNKHLLGRGCPNCGIESRTKQITKTTAEFVEGARKVHGERYDYSKVKYKKGESKVIVTCPTHGDFKQSPTSHLGGAGCPKCGFEASAVSSRKTTAQFIEDARKVHGDRYDYTKVRYLNSYSKVIIACLDHGDFNQNAGGHISGIGCPKCGCELRDKLITKTTAEFIEDARKVHGDRYDYRQVKYKNALTKATITCPEHGDFEQKPNSHLSGMGCPECGIESRSASHLNTTKGFIEDAREVHGDRYDYSMVRYTSSSQHVTIICSRHGVFEQTPNNHCRGAGCPVCAKSGRALTAVYLAEICTSNESFLKVGVTAYNLHRRFAYRRKDFEVSKIEIFWLSHPQIAETIESELHELFAEYQHIPNIRFGGWTECFKLEALPLLKVEFKRLKKLHATKVRKHR